MELSKNDNFSVEGSHRRRSGSRPPKAYRILEGLSEGLIYVMVVLSPWLFGTTDPWAVRIMNGVAYALGALLAAKWLFRWKTGFKPLRWDDVGEGIEEADRGRRKIRNGLTRALGWLTVAILTYVLISALNARASFYVKEQRFEYYDCFYWLPHSYDKGATMFLFWMYFGLAIFFWATRDWLLGKTRRELTNSNREIPVRLERLLWVVCFNGGLLAIEALLQRLSGTGKVLWLLTPRWNQTADVQYGPYPYRSNAAQYFNLLWPMCLGFWWLLQADKKRAANRMRLGTGPDVLLLPMIILMAASPIISTSRGGAIVAALQMTVGLAVLINASRKGRGNRTAIIVIFATMFLVGAFFGWHSLAARLRELAEDDLGGRAKIYANTRTMSKDFGLFGSGPGSFAALYQLYRSGEKDEWIGYLHNDWLETKITFGTVGISMLLSVILISAVKSKFTKVNAEAIPLIDLLYLSLTGALIHAKFDFPLQIYSILLMAALCLILLECSSNFFEEKTAHVKYG